MDQLLEQARASTDRAKRKQLYADLERILVGDVAEVYLTHGTVAQISTNKIRNFTLIPDGMNRFAEVWKS